MRRGVKISGNQRFSVVLEGEIEREYWDGLGSSKLRSKTDQESIFDQVNLSPSVHSNNKF